VEVVVPAKPDGQYITENVSGAPAFFLHFGLHFGGGKDLAGRGEIG
jgi:hypothetical protein